MKSTSAIVVLAALSAVFAYAGEFTSGGCFARWDDRTLVVGNGKFSRGYRAVGDSLLTDSLRHGACEWIDASRVRAGEPAGFAVTAAAARRSCVGEEGVRLEVTTGARRRTLWLFASVPGVLTEDPKVADMSATALSGRPYDDTTRLREFFWRDADVLHLRSVHVRAGELEVLDQTDVHNELTHEHEWLLMTSEMTIGRSVNVFWLEDTLSGDGLAFLRFAPLPADRTRSVPDFGAGANEGWKAPNRVWVASVANGYPVAELAYRGGRLGRIAAYRSIQRALRRYVAGRDGLFLTNTWGDGNRDARICEEFMMKEIAAGGELGADVIQMDDGWQSGRSQNSALLKGRAKGAWANFRAADPDFWKLDPVKFPSGMAKLVDAAKARGMSFGLWFGPDKTDDYAGWEADADILLDFHARYGIRYFKVDGISTESERGFENQRRMFAKMLAESKGDMVFDLDVTGCAKRPGYFGLPDTGPLFLENRYISSGRYWPHFTLRNLWTLSEVIDPVRMRVELANHLRGGDCYPAGDPLAPANWKADTVFATAMVASPLGWFELSGLKPETVAAMKPLIAVWKRERANLHGGLTVPVGAKPDGVSWTGFATLGADGVSAYALLFRELAPAGDWRLGLSELFPSCQFERVERLGGRGEAKLADGVLEVAGVEPLDFIWLKLDGRHATERKAAAEALTRRNRPRSPAFEDRFFPTYPSVCDVASATARPVPDFLRGAVMYQLFTRMFTPEGTFAAARSRLGELRALGVDVIYLTPHQLADDDGDRRFWSARQKSCGLDNPANPYRQKDFFAVDPEYGTKADLRAFVDEVHRLGMKVMFDLVYFHCGPKAVFLGEHPDYIVRNPDGTPRLGAWAFPEMDLANGETREYLYRNMESFVRDYDVDGFRCDVGDMLPVDFWEEGYRRVKRLKDGIFMMCEGLKGDDQLAAFDLSYGFYTQWTLVEFLKGTEPASMLEKAWRAQRRDFPRDFHWMRCFENHDFAHVNPGGKRKEELYGHELNAAMIATCFLLDGVPMLYNGQEIADAAPHAIFANRDHGGWCIDRSRSGDAVAQERLALVKRLTTLRHEHPALFDAPLEWLDTGDPERAYAFRRRLPEGTVTLAVNISREPVEFELEGAACRLEPHGFELRGDLVRTRSGR